MICFDCFLFIAVIKNNKQSIKNIDACTHLSKLNISNQEAEGINCPGVAQRPNIMSVQRIESIRE